MKDECHECGGTGGVDSGGMTPWGSPIDIPCPSCTHPLAKERTIKLVTSTGKDVTLGVKEQPEPGATFRLILQGAAELMKVDTAAEWVRLVEGENDTKVFRGFLVSNGLL